MKTNRPKTESKKAPSKLNIALSLVEQSFSVGVAEVDERDQLLRKH